MTLYRQLMGAVLFITILVFSGTLFVSLDNTRQYLNEQMASNAQDTATSLGLSLSPQMAVGDVFFMQSMVDAIFDRGYYREIRLLDNDGKVLVDRVVPIKIDGVPDWFVRALPLNTPAQSAGVMAGWKQGGVITVAAHPGYAYGQLWRAALGGVWWMLGTLFVAGAVLAMVVRRLFRPLVQVENQAKAITEGEFAVVDSIPGTRELRRVVTAMNRMSQKVGQMLSEQSQIAEDFRTAANTDQLTGLSNRGFFMLRLDQILKDSERHSTVAVVVVHLDGLMELNARAGFETGNERIVAAVKQAAATLPGDAFWGRIGGAEFAAVLVDWECADVETYVDRIVAEMLMLDGYLRPVPGARVGGALRPLGGSASDLLAQADMALGQAAAKGRYAWAIYRATEHAEPIHGHHHWLTLVREAVSEKRMILAQQLVHAVDASEELHREVYCRLQDGPDGLIPAGMFLPAVRRGGLGPWLDKQVAELLFTTIAETAVRPGIYSLNLNAESVRDPLFVDWLEGEISRLPASVRVVFELGEFQLRAAMPDVLAFAQRVRSWPSGLGVDNFGVQAEAFGYLRTLRPDFLKLDGSLIRDISTNPERRFYVRALTGIAHDLDILVIAEQVESQRDMAAAQALGIRYAQGRCLSDVEPII